MHSPSDELWDAMHELWDAMQFWDAMHELWDAMHSLFFITGFFMTGFFITFFHHSLLDAWILFDARTMNWRQRTTSKRDQNISDTATTKLVIYRCTWGWHGVLKV